MCCLISKIANSHIKDSGHKSKKYSPGIEKNYRKAKFVELLRLLINHGQQMSNYKKLLHICYLLAFISMIMCPVVHAQCDRYIGHAIFNFPFHSKIQNYVKGDIKFYHEDMLYTSLPDYNIKSSLSQNLPPMVSINSSNNLFIVTTTRFNL